MDRRSFLRLMCALGVSLTFPSIFWRRTAKASLPPGINYARPQALPQVINIFLYGGPSELAANLTNIEEIDASSQNPYPSGIVPSRGGGGITANNFWRAAGGDIMEELVGGGDMSIYRTIHRVKDDNKGHGLSVNQNLVGNLDASAPGIATTLAAVLLENDAFGKPVDELNLPFVSFEGDSTLFNLGDLDIPLTLRPIAMDSNFSNPYERSGNSYIDDTADADLENLARQVSSAFGEKHRKINDAFAKRAELADFVANSFNRTTVDANLPYGNPSDPDTDNSGKLVYPDTNFGNLLKSAVSLAVSNPDTVFISLGSGGLGGWDDHSESTSKYPGRMQELMAALRCAVKHMKWMTAPRQNIVINVFGDFGRNVNLNNAMGWDHGNNQNLYTLAGWGIPGRQLGKLVGKTKWTGTPFENRQFTAPTNDSYQCEPFAIASTIYRYFGIQNPELLTGEAAIDELSPPNELL